MNISDLRLVLCPYCGSDITVATVRSGRGNEMETGTVSCECDTFPVVDGILVLKKPVHRLVTEDLERHGVVAARRHLIDMHPGYNRMLRAILPESLMDTWARTYVRVPLVARLGLRTVLSPLRLYPGERRWAQYLMTLPGRAESKIPGSLTRALKRPPRVFVDVGCGITPYASDADFGAIPTIIGVDKSYALLFLSSILFPNTRQSMICADLSHGYPVKPRVADLAISLNCFTYLYNQRRTLSSMVQSLTPSGAAFIGDLHPESGVAAPYWYPQKPSFYTNGVADSTRVLDYETLLTSLGSLSDTFPGAPYKTRGRSARRYAILIRPERIRL